jgi:ATP-dependent RNA helicase RhlE
MAELLRAVSAQGYTEPTPIQSQAIPLVLQGRDVLGAAQTGTGKTAGFTLPMLQRLSAKANVSASPARHPVRALVLVPTRELAAQVHESIQIYGRHLQLRSTVVYGGINIKPQIDALRRGIDILVATPGRLLDHVQQKTVDLRQVEILVLDEADRMLDMGFLPDLRRILALLPKQRQNLLFSATFSNEIRSLAGAFLHDPATVEVARRNTPVEMITQYAHPVAADRKRALLAHLIQSKDWRQVLVFTKTKHGANRLAEQLARHGIDADAIHGNKAQGARTRTLSRFKASELQVMVATDIAARGLDIDALPHVVNYDLPHVPEDYIHRIGRTGRAGATGEAVSLVSPEDRPLFAAIERLIGRRIDQRAVTGFEMQAAAADSVREPMREPGRHATQRQPAQGRPTEQPRGARRNNDRGDKRGGQRRKAERTATYSGQNRSSGRPARPAGDTRAASAADSRLASPAEGRQAPAAPAQAEAKPSAIMKIGALLGFRSKMA